MNKILFIILLLILTSCGNKNTSPMNTPEENSASKQQEIEFARKQCEENKHLRDSAYFPFSTYILEDVSDGTRYAIIVTSATGMCYFELFEKYGVYANGPGWQGVIEQVIEADLPELQGNLHYDSEADACLIYLPTSDTQMKLAEHLHQIFTDENKLKIHLEKLDLSRIDA